MGVGDIDFAHMISSIQTDEARHAQQGEPTLEILDRARPGRRAVDDRQDVLAVARLFALLTGPSMDYYTPLEHRKQSFKEFMEEWIIDQFVRPFRDYGLEKPWYWDEFIEDLDVWHHSLPPGRVVLAPDRVVEARRPASRRRSGSG